MADGVEAIIAGVLAAAPPGDRGPALCAKGDALVAAGEIDSALACFDRALGLDVALPAAWVGRARILSTRKRDNEAFGCIRRALDADPRCAPALVHKGHILRGRGQPEEALVAYDAALAAGAGEETRAFRALVLRTLGRADEPVPRPDPLVAKKSDPSLLLGPAIVPVTTSKRPSGRVVRTSSAPNRLPQIELDQAVFDDVRALGFAGRHVEGLRKLEPIAKRCPSSREAWTLRGQILFALAQYDAALASVERVVRLDAKDQDALRLMIKILAATHKDVRALETASTLVTLAPNDAEAHRLRADCLVGAMRHAEAVAVYEKVILLVPDDPLPWLGLGRTLRQLRRSAEARMALGKARSLAEAKGHSAIVTQIVELLARLPDEV